MGASGAGKTTFLNVLAGHSGLNATVTGSITVNGEEISPEKMRSISAFVQQEDVIMDTMTGNCTLTCCWPNWGLGCRQSVRVCRPIFNWVQNAWESACLLPCICLIGWSDTLVEQSM